MIHDPSGCEDEDGNLPERNPHPHFRTFALSHPSLDSARVHAEPSRPMILKRFYDEKLAHASWLVGCAATGEALVVDPNRDVEPYVDAAAREGLRITHVAETHIHADFVSGTRELAQRTGATPYLSGEGGDDWRYAWADGDGAELVMDGSRFMVGNVRVDVMHTPG